MISPQNKVKCTLSIPGCAGRQASPVAPYLKRYMHNGEWRI